MTTYFIRHGRTAYSARHLLNGNPALPVLLDEEGLRQVAIARPAVQGLGFRSCRTSSFPRTEQTARLLLKGTTCRHASDPRLDEPDYGVFEGDPFSTYAIWLRGHGPTARPPGSCESQREALLRMLDACADLPGSPGPRLVVAHGLLLSVLHWHRQHSDKGGDQGGFPVFFPEAAYVEPIAVSDACLQRWTAHLRAHLQEELDSSEMTYGTGISSEDDRAVLRLPEPVPASLEENESDA